MYRRLVISGGGNKLRTYLGAIQALEKQLSRVNHFVGVSAGAVLAASLALGATSDQVVQQEDASPFCFQWSWLLTAPFTCFQDGGFVDHDYLRQIFIKGMDSVQSNGSTWTFKQLYDERHVILEIPALSTALAKRHVFNHVNTPDELIVEALVASCAIPIVMTPYYHDNDILLDGGLFIACPWKTIDDEPFIGCAQSGKTLGLMLDYIRATEFKPETVSFSSMFQQMIEVPFGVLSKYELEPTHYTNSNNQTCQQDEQSIDWHSDKHLLKIWVDNKRYGGMFTNLFPNDSHKSELYDIGFQAAQHFKRQLYAHYNKNNKQQNSNNQPQKHRCAKHSNQSTNL